MPTVHLLDYVAGNVRSLVNAIEKLGWTVEWVKTPADVAKADVWFYFRQKLRDKNHLYSIN
jgi:imidazoleglycerol phosphate synthase glutamine amidotransferase subunit HisH